MPEFSDPEVARNFLEGKLDFMRNVDDILSAEFLESMNEAMEGHVTWENDKDFKLAGEEKTRSINNLSDYKALENVLEKAGLENIANELAEAQGIDPRRVENATREDVKTRSEENAAQLSEDITGSAEEPPRPDESDTEREREKKLAERKQWYDKINDWFERNKKAGDVIRFLFKAGVGIGILEAMAQARSGCYLVQVKSGRRYTKLEGVSANTCNCDNSTIKAACASVCGGKLQTERVEGTTTHTSSSSCDNDVCSCNEYRPQYFKENFWDTFVYYASEAGMIIDDGLHLVDAGVKSPSAFMSWFKYVLIAAGVIAVLVVIGFLVKIFRK